MVGYIETHQRAETEELIKELEVLPGMNVDAVIRCCPQLLLTDEFAHTNAPDSANRGICH